jgi:quercetin 2,3-dioxygenase
MSNLDTRAEELRCAPKYFSGVLHSRDVPLGGPRAMHVRRTLPHRDRSLIGAWCFVDHYGPVRVRDATAMDLPPHPHTGLQTVTWLFSGEVHHSDSGGVNATVQPGELNLMTAGAGIAHAEVATASTTVLHGAQLWVALPDADRHTDRRFDHYVPLPRRIPGGIVRVFLGELMDNRSPVQSFTPLLGAQLDIEPRAKISLELNPTFEHGVLLDQGSVDVDGTQLGFGDLAVHPAGSRRLTLTNRRGESARALLLGGEPFSEQIIMWWNFIGRSHDEIVALREMWMNGDERFGEVRGYQGRLPRLPAPALPNATLRPRN